MKIVNAMFGKKLGGIEQAFLDYTEILALKNHEVSCIIRPFAQITPELKKLTEKYPNIKIFQVPNFGKWDILAKFILEKILKKLSPHLVICHGNRPSSLLRNATKKLSIKQASVLHNYWFKDVLKSDYLIGVSQDICNRAMEFSSSIKAYKVPNLIRIEACEAQPRHTPVTIGVMARMVEKEGIDVFLQACEILKMKGIAFKAIIGGDGELRNKYQTLRDILKLNESVQFSGWVKNKKSFYDKIDIFCLPSLSEPFGIVLLEAMAYKKPIVATNIEGPSEILTHGIDATLVNKSDSMALAVALEEIIFNYEKSFKQAEKAFETAKNNYDIAVVSEILNSIIINN